MILLKSNLKTQTFKIISRRRRVIENSRTKSFVYIVKTNTLHGQVQGLQGHGDLGNKLPRYFIRGQMGCNKLRGQHLPSLSPWRSPYQVENRPADTRVNKGKR